MSGVGKRFSELLSKMYSFREMCDWVCLAKTLNLVCHGHSCFYLIRINQLPASSRVILAAVPCKSKDNLRINVHRSGSGEGFRLSATNRSCTKASMGLRISVSVASGFGTSGRFTGYNDQIPSLSPWAEKTKSRITHAKLKPLITTT